MTYGIGIHVFICAFLSCMRAQYQIAPILINVPECHLKQKQKFYYFKMTDAVIGIAWSWHVQPIC
jgi:hypothetical protein